MVTAKPFASAFSEGDKGLVASLPMKPVPGGEQ